MHGITLMADRAECATVCQPAQSNAPQLGGNRAVTLTGREPQLGGGRLRMPPLIVHVDDDEGIRTLMKLILEVHAGYRIVGFASGREALDFCRTTRPDILITDVRHPDIDGLTLCHLIRNDPDLLDLRLVILSACVSSSISQQAYALNATLLSKPCDPFALIGEMDQIVLEQGLAIPHRTNG